MRAWSRGSGLYHGQCKIRGCYNHPHLPTQKANQTPKTPARPIRNQALDWLVVQFPLLLCLALVPKTQLCVRGCVSCGPWSCFSDKEDEEHDIKDGAEALRAHSHPSSYGHSTSSCSSPLATQECPGWAGTGKMPHDPQQASANAC